MIVILLTKFVLLRMLTMMLQSFIMLDPILLVNMLTYDAFITSYNDFFAEPMAGEDDDDIIIPAVFIGQDGKL